MLLLNFIASEEHVYSKSTSVVNSVKSQRATLRFDLQVVSVDELGISILSSHLIPKGSVVLLGGEFMKELTGKGDPRLFTASISWVEESEVGYCAYLEVDATDQAMNQAIHSWLARV